VWMKSVARCAQIKISTKCRRECSEEQEEIEEVKLRREKVENLQGEKSLKSSLKVSGQDSFSEGDE
jgi:hypothetical protein